MIYAPTLGYPAILLTKIFFFSYIYTYVSTFKLNNPYIYIIYICLYVREDFSSLLYAGNAYSQASYMSDLEAGKAVLCSTVQVHKHNSLTYSHQENQD